MKRLLGLDYGDKTIGVALSDELLLVARGLEVINRDNEQSIKKSIARLGEIIKQYEVGGIVLGYPKNMDNSLGERCEKTILFKERLERNFKKTSVILWDERLSTVAADRVLSQLTRVKREQVVDKIAAIFILQGYLDYLTNSNSKV